MPKTSTPMADFHKCRTLVFDDSDAVIQAHNLINTHFGLPCIVLPHAKRLLIAYDLSSLSLQAILDLLESNQVAVSDYFMHRLHLKLMLYSEDVQLSNTIIQPRDTKSKEAFCQIYQQHKHGDEDDTPEELRHIL